MAAAYPMMQESVWLDQAKYEKAEAHYQEHLAQTRYGVGNSPAAAAAPAPAQTTGGAGGVDHTKRIEKLEKENDELRKMINGLCERIKKLELQVSSGSGSAPAKPAAEQAKPAKPADDDDDIDSDENLFGSDSEEDEEAERAAEERRAKLAAEALAKKKNKPAVIAKSSIIFDVKGWDDETDFKELERLIRGIQKEGLVWGQQVKLIPVAYGVQKLQINAIVVDSLVSVDDLSEEICEFEDLVQSVDIAAFNKI